VRRLREPKNGTPATASRPTDPELERVEEDLRRALGTKVRLARSRRGGRIVIEFYGEDELTRLYERLVGAGA
jgi:ParB family chromosome partitioning protein